MRHWKDPDCRAARFPRDTEREVDQPVGEDPPSFDGDAQPAISSLPCWGPLGWFCDPTATDTGYLDCDGDYINEVGVNWHASYSHYDSIHITPTALSRGGAGSSLMSWTVANGAYDEMVECLDDHGLDLYVISWTAIWQQIRCHAYWQQFGGGASWDLEGYRDANPYYLSPTHGCNWTPAA